MDVQGALCGGMSILEWINSEVEPNLEDYYVFAGGILEESEE